MDDKKLKALSAELAKGLKTKDVWGDKFRKLVKAGVRTGNISIRSSATQRISARPFT
ncbi:hypothetical protein SAMN05216502_10779 [Citrobacter amalonaticus]|jgi:hypothetical protein|uniref:Uncharacterized protein n=1 Tax=Citrobacter braakii TaxID=57706 RepID=A0AAD1KZI6_CITBR|nr:hypothetical protein CIAM_01100 [Citrobacter amalonaticus]BDN94950.1 hypothetical protein KAM621c_00550 [Citrobacter braakii]SFB13235.1 hypothetical protein SAMN05216502_10779 [Citrobacter amalonaticus]SUX56885.1 Uncharacterised protein [Citrobacter amalonaticus]